MKKSIITLALAVMLFEGILVSNVQESSAKENLKTQIQKEITGQKAGKITYYLNKKNLMSVKPGCKAKKIEKNLIDFKVSGAYVYYVNDGNKLYRMKKNGTEKIKIATGCKKIHMIRGKYICYSGNSGIFTIKRNGKRKTKIFRYGTNPIYMNGRYYATEAIIQENNQGKDCVLESVKKDGTNKKTEHIFKNAYRAEPIKVNGEIAVVSYYSNKAASIWRKNDAGVYEETILGREKYIIGNVEYSMGKWLVFATELTEANKDVYSIETEKNVCLYEVKKDGDLELFMDFSSMSISYSQGYNGTKKEGRYYTITTNNGYNVYVVNINNKKVIRILSPIKTWGSDSAGFDYKINKNVIFYQCYANSKKQFVYRKYKL